MAQHKYKVNDIVWVLASKRLGWWPARVENVDKLPPDLKKDVTEDTLCVVKYLNEDNYQFVGDANNVCLYTSDKKEEHISAGMKKYFEKKKVNETSSPFMKFPTDVKQAEYLTGGSPSIVDHERFQPKKSTPAQSNYKNIFVDPRSKEISKVKSPAKKGRRASVRSASPPPTTKVNHPRFQGHSDHEVRIRTQDSSPVVTSSRSSSTLSSPAIGTAGYACDVCAFTTARLNLMIMHKKTHLNVGNAAAVLTPSASTAQTGQKRPTTSSPANKRTPKRARKSTAAAKVAEERAEEVCKEPGDLFDQVKRSLEAKESGATNNATPAPGKASSTPKRAPRTPKSPKTPAAKASSVSAKTSETNANSSNTNSNSKAAPNPKKKWLKSSMQNKVEINPEVKIKLMADWEEEEDQPEPPPPPPPPAEQPIAMSHDSDSEHDGVLSKSGLLHRRSDDEDDDEMETDSPATSNAAKQEEEEPMAGINAEIEKLNADLNGEKIPVKVNGEGSAVVVNGCGGSNGPDRPPTPAAEEPAKSEEEIKLDVASLLAETTVPVLPPSMMELESKPAVETTTMAVVQTEVDGESGEGGNILMQVEGGETYMVVWEPGSAANIQELLAGSVEGEGNGTQTLLIDPSSLQAGTDLENLFQMAVAAAGPPPPPSQNEQSNSATRMEEESTNKSTYKPKKSSTPSKGVKLVVDDLFARHGNAVDRGLEQNDLVWAQLAPQMFIPAAVLDASDAKVVKLVAFDVHRPGNERKFPRNKIIPTFSHQLNVELLDFCRTRNKKVDYAKVDGSYDHAYAFSQLRQPGKFPELTVRQYLSCCNRSPVKLFAQQYLTDATQDELRELPEVMDTSDSMNESTGEEADELEEMKRKLKIVHDMLDRHVLTEECLDYLAGFAGQSSERMSLYLDGNWKQLSLSATCGILENSRLLYSKLADFLQTNVHRVRQLADSQDHKRIFILDVLLPEALNYGVQKQFNVTAQEAGHIVVYGIDSGKMGCP